VRGLVRELVASAVGRVNVSVGSVVGSFTSCLSTPCMMTCCTACIKAMKC
jgi:hypothetical protein